MDYYDIICMRHKEKMTGVSVKQLQEFAQEILNVQMKTPSYTLNDMLEAIKYGFEYHRDSMNDEIDVPLGNKLQWMIHYDSDIKGEDRISVEKRYMKIVNKS